jgi:membrane protein YdbS with pleckstrin-like domain
VDELFAPLGADWRPVSPRLATVRRLVLSAIAGVVAVLLLVLGTTGLLPRGPVAVLALVLLAAYAWVWWLVGRNAAHWRYAEQDEDLLIASGAYFRRLVVVPYGRMQYVDVQSGPLDQLFGIATLRLHTASPGTSARIPGLHAEDAARLRDRLTAMGETQAAGL